MGNKVKLLLFFLIMMLQNQPILANSELKVSIPFLPQQINHLEINSVYEYIVFDDLLRPLVKYDSNGELSADLVYKWEIKNQNKKYIFSLKKDQYFSDGSKITAKDVVKSLGYLVAKPDIIHGDGSKIKKVTEISELDFEIELLKPDPFFLTELSAPEYRIVKNNSQYIVTSGAYYVQESKKNELTVVLNKFVKFPTSVKFNTAHFSQYDPTKKLSNELLNSADIIWPSTGIDHEEIKRVKNSGFEVYDLNMGFSYWLSLNPNTTTKDERSFISQKLDQYWRTSDFFEKYKFTRSLQLFLPYGPGRISKSEIEIFSNSTRTVKKIVRPLIALMPSNAHQEILDSLKILDTNVMVDFYENFEQYAKKIKNKDYDLALVNNDLSSVDLRSSIVVTFNPSRPLVFTDKKNKLMDKLLSEIKKEQNSQARNAMIKKLSFKVLEDVLIYPLYYDNGYIFIKKGLDLSMWDKAGAETSLWKIK